MKKFLLAIFFVFFFIYFFTSAGATPHNYFTRLASSFLQGKYWIDESPPWFSELVPGPEGRFYVIQPPMPAVLAMPFVSLFGKDFQQQILAHILGAGLVVLTMILSYRIKKNKALAVWSGVLVGIGSIVWYLASTGSVWYLGQVTAAFFLTAALVETFGKKRAWLVGIFLGGAYLSRIHTILSFPFFVFVINKRGHFIKNLIYFGLGMAPFFLSNFLYNFVRFGTILDKGYFLIPGIYSEPWFSKGMLNIAYIPEHLRILFLTLPKFLPNPPYIEPSWYGLAIWITTPAFVYSIKAHFKEKVVKLAWLAILLIFILVALRGGTGWTQFGYRYAVDFYPFLTLLTIIGVAKSGLKWHHWVLLFLGVLVNFWGVIWINKFGWVSF